MSKLFNWAAARIVAAFALALPLAAMADVPMTNPVTGETETYSNAFIGETEEWNSADNWDTTTTPFIVTTYSPALVTGKVVSTSTVIDGWTLRVGAYNGAAVTWNGGITKIQAGSLGCWLTADETSSITIASFAGNQLEGSDAYPFKLSSANAGGITWSAGLTSAGNTTLPFWYYLKGAGTVVYDGDITVANAQVIKQADVALSGNEKSVQSKTLVTFGSGTTKTFAADATIKRLNSSGTDLNDDAHLAVVNTTGTTSLTTDDAVGTCELVQTSTGIELFWVDGDPEALTPTVYKPSININFTNGSGNGLTTVADVGLSGYGVPGTSWNNYVVANSTFGTVNAVDSTGAASVLPGVSVTISGTRGSHNCSALTPASDPRHGYIDENAGNMTPTVTVTGIPYYKYRVIVYHSTDTANVPFGYDTINGTDYTYVNDALSEGASAWGASGAANSANAISEGGNTLVTGELSGSTLTVVGHRGGGDSSARGCIAAIQIIEVKPDVGENDLEIAVDGDTNYTVSEVQNLSGTVYLTGSGTLTLDGSAKISASTIDVGLNVTLNINADRLDGITFTGAGTVVYDGSQPDTTKGFDNSAWTGTVWVKNIGDTSRGEATGSKVNTCLGSNTADASSNDLNKWGNANSFVKFTNVRAYMAAANVPWTLILEDDSTNYAWYNNEGWTARTITIAGLKGNGTFWDINDGGCRPFLNFTDASQFSGSIKALGKQVFLNGAGTGNASDLLSGRIVVPADQVLTISAGETWHTRNGLVVNGTLSVNGTLGSESTSSAVSGAGTVVFTGRAPTVSGDAWWKNAGWTGTVQIDNITDLVGTSDWGSGTYLDFNSYGNANSVIKLGNITGWLAGETCNVPVNLAGTLTINNGFSGSAFTFKKLISNGGYITATDQAATAMIVIEDGSEYAGYIGLNAKMVVFGTDNPEFVKGQVYVSSDAAITVPAVNTAYWAVGNIVVAGELKADSLSRFGGGTHINTTGDGVFTLTSTGNGQETETDTDYARISGTDGSLKYEGTGWRALSTNNFPTAVTLVNEQAGDILLSRALTYTVGSLSGSKNFQGNYGSGNRYLNVIQSKDTEWSGKVVNDGSSRFAGLKLDASSTGTLTLSGTASQNVALEVNGGAVNLTGTWKGATTVAGTFGGTGTLTGNLTFSDGATFKAFGTDSDGLAVSGAVSYPETGTVTVDFAEVPTADTVLLTASDLDASKFALATGVSGSLAVEEGALVYKSPFVTITVPAIEHTSVEVAVDGVVVGPTLLGGTEYVATNGAAVVVTYSAASGYEVTGGTFEFTVSGPTTIDIKDVSVAQYVAKVRNLSTSEYDEYTTLAAAIAAADGTTHANSIMLIAGVTESEVTVSSAIVISGNYTINADVKVATGGQLQLMQAVLSGKLTIEDGGVYATNGGALDTVVAKDGAKIQLTTLSADTAPLTVTTLTVEGELMVVSSYASAERGTTYKALSYVTANATFETGAEIVGGGEWTNGAVVDGDNTVVTLAITAVARVGDVYYDDLADAIAAAGGVEVVDLMVAPAETIKLGAGETLKIKKYSFEVSVALADGLLTPPHYLEFETDSSTLVSTYTVKSYVAAIGDDKYESLAAAIEAATAGQTVTLLADDRVSFANIAVESGVPSNGSIVINKSLTINGAGFTVYGNTDLSMKNITNNVQDPNQEAAVDLVDGSNVVGFFVKSGNVTFTNITFTVFGDTAYVNKFGYTPIQTASAYTGTLTLTNVNFNKFNRTAVCVSGGTLAMTGGTISGGTVNKNNGDYFQQPVEVRGGTATISGVMITGGDDIAGNGGGAIVAWGDTTVNNVNIDFVGYGVWADVADVAITGENTAISATTNSVFVEEGGSATIAAGDFSGSLAVDSDPKSSIVVSGGTFDRQVPAAYCASGKVPTTTPDASGKYTVVDEPSGIDPAAGVTETTVAYENAGSLTVDELTAAVVAAAVTAGKITPPTGASVTPVAYAAYFTYTVTGESGNYTLAIAGLQPTVLEDVDASVAAQLVNTTTGSNMTVTVKPGLYYGFTTGTTPTLAEPELQLSTGETVTVSKPGTTQGFVKIKVSSTNN